MKCHCKDVTPISPVYMRKTEKSYLDVYYIIWNGIIDKRLAYKSILNNMHPNIQFTIEYSNKQLHILGIMIKPTTKL